MPDPIVVIGTITLGVLGGTAAWWSKRAAARAGIGVTQPEAIASLQAETDTWKERYRLERELRMNAEADLVTIKAAQTLERELAAQCRSDLDDERSKVRRLRDQLDRQSGPRVGS